MLMTLSQAQALLPGSEVVGDGGIAIERVHSDSRTLRAGDLFVALRGENFDGHDFLPQARRAGAAAALAERGLSGDLPGLPGLRVADTLTALQQLAAAWRRRMQLPLIAVTGSNGKTTVTQMIAAILRAWHGDAALATAGNFNNHIGVPLTLLRLRQDPALHHRAAVLELGMNHPGEIALLAAMAAPTVALVNNAQREHQEFMDGVGAVARENGSVIEALPDDGVAVIPAADAQAALWRRLAGRRRVVDFALDTRADVHARAEWDSAAGRWQIDAETPAGRVQTVLHQPGRHNALNAVAAAAAALAAGAPMPAVAQGLADFRPVAGRSHLERLSRAAGALTLVDDSYNANPDSVLAAIDVLAELPRPRWLILGDMGEVGPQGPAFHAEVGRHARERGIEHFWAVGELAVHAGADRHFGTVAALLGELRHAPSSAAVLVKGSKFMKMGQVVQALRQGGADAA